MQPLWNLQRFWLNKQLPPLLPVLLGEFLANSSANSSRKFIVKFIVKFIKFTNCPENPKIQGSPPRQKRLRGPREPENPGTPPRARRDKSENPRIQEAPQFFKFCQFIGKSADQDEVERYTHKEPGRFAETQRTSRLLVNVKKFTYVSICHFGTGSVVRVDEFSSFRTSGGGDPQTFQLRLVDRDAIARCI